MKTLNVLCMIFLGYPAMFVGYLFGAVKSGFSTGVFFYDRHETQILEPATPKEPQQGTGGSGS